MSQQSWAAWRITGQTSAAACRISCHAVCHRARAGARFFCSLSKKSCHPSSSVSPAALSEAPELLPLLPLEERPDPELPAALCSRFSSSKSASERRAAAPAFRVVAASRDWALAAAAVLLASACTCPVEKAEFMASLICRSWVSSPFSSPESSAIDGPLSSAAGGTERETS